MKQAQKSPGNSSPNSRATSRATSPVNSPSHGSRRAGRGTPKASGTSTPIRFGNGLDQRQIDISGLNISIGDEEKVTEEPPKMALAREKVIDEAKKVLDARGANDKRGVSLVVIGKVIACILMRC
jgi:elongation factor 1 alpha-like protein